MRSFKHIIKHTSLSDIISLYPLGDIHLGNRYCNEKLFLSTVNKIKEDPHAYWVGMGDIADFIKPSDPRFDPTSVAEWFEVEDLVDVARVQRDRFLEMIDPIVDKCIGILKGNHEHSIHRHYEHAIYDDIVAMMKGRMKEPPKKLGLGYSGFIILSIQRFSEEGERVYSWPVTLFLHHGWGGGRLAGGKALKLERAMKTYDADIILVGHWHTTQTLRSSVIGVTRGARIRKRDRIGVVTGHWLEGHPEDGETYAERAGYYPSTLGCPIIQFIPSDKTYRVMV